MALEDSDINKLAKAITDAAQGGGGAAGTRSNINAAKSLEELLREYSKLTEHAKKQGAQYSLLNRALQQNRTIAQEYTKDLQDLDKTIENTSDSYDRSLLQEKRRELERTAAHATMQQNLSQLSASIGKMSSTVFAGAGSFTKGLLGNSSSTELAAGLMTSSLDIAGQASQAAGQAAGNMGQVMMNSTNPKVKALGAAAAVAGPLLGSLGESASKLAKFGVEVLSKEVEKTVKAFNETSAAGALFTDGMTGMRLAAGQAGLTVEQFSGVVKNNSESLAASGMGVTEGAKRIGSAMAVGGDQAKNQLLKLGFSFEEQAGLYAQVAADMNKNAMGRRATDAQVADQTMKYADNLRTISAITGEDAKKKMEQVKQEANQLAFRQKLAKLPLEQQEATKRAMANMSDIERKNFMDMVNFGAVINKEGAIYEATVDGAAEKAADAFASYNAGTLDGAEQQKRNAEYSDRINKGIMEGNEALGTAAAVAGSSLAGLAESMSKQIDVNNKYTESAVAAAQANVEGQKNTQDRLTTAVTGAEVELQRFKQALETQMSGPDGAITKFAEVSKAMLSSVMDMMKQAGLGRGAQEEKGFLGKANDWLKETKILSSGATAIGGAAMVGGAAASATGVGAIGGIPLATIGAVASRLGMLAGALGYAEGGVSLGPDEGYLTKLHGTELVVPLNNDGSPKPGTQGAEGLARIASSSAANAGGSAEMAMAVSGLADIFKETISKQEELIRVMTQNRDYTERLMQNMS